MKNTSLEQKKKIFPLAFSLILFIISLTLLYLNVGWQGSLAIFLILWANNISEGTKT